MKIFQLLIATALPCLIFIRGFTQPTTTGIDHPKYTATHWGLDEGLSQAETYCIIKDRNGFIWVGTGNGLNRFDGNAFKVYYPDFKTSNAIAGVDSRTSINEDSLGNLWIGTDKGISRYDIKADSFTNFFPEKPGNHYQQIQIASFWSTKDKVMCIEQENLITAYDIHNLSKSVIGSLEPYKGVMGGPSPGYSIFDSVTESVWIIANGAKMEERNLLQFNLRTKKISFYAYTCFDNLINHQHSSEAMVFDAARRCIWLNSEDGLIRFSLSEKKFERAARLQGRWVGIDIDKNGRIWVASQEKGIVIYDPATTTLTKVFEEDSTIQKAVSFANARIYCDRDGITWSGFWDRKGFYQISPYQPSVHRFVMPDNGENGLSSNDVGSIINGGSGKMLIGTRNGLNIYDTRTNLFQHYRQSDLPGLLANIIDPVITDTTSGMIWINNTIGWQRNVILRINLTSRKVEKVLFRNAENKVIDVISSFPYKKYKGSAIFAEKSGEKTNVYQLDKKTNSANFIFQVKDKKYIQFSDTDDENIYFRNENDPFFSTYTFVDNQWKNISTPLDTTFADIIFFENKNSTYWVAGNKKLYHFKKNFQLINMYGEEDGLPDLPIRSIHTDFQHNVWFTTDRSLHQLNVNTGKVMAVSAKDGFVKQDFGYPWGRSIDNSGHLYFPSYGFGAGFDLIEPEKFSTQPSFVYIRSFSVNQVPISVNMTEKRKLNLKYFQQNIIIETGLIDFYAKGKSRLRYRLEGHDTSWIYAPYYYTIRYDGLKHGKYTLVLQASNANNEFNGPELRYDISISQAFYFTIWAWLFYISLLITVILLYSKYRSRALTAKNLLLENKVQERTTELRQSLESLTAAQAQLIHAEKMASLGELTAGIAHEIQNPLNFVNNFSEINKELIEELQDEQKKSVRDEYVETTILSNITENLDRILLHGKRADNIVKGMLQHARQHNGTKNPEDINALAMEYLNLSFHGVRAKEKSFNCQLQTKLDENIGNISIVSQDIARVLLNIYNNSFFAVGEKQKLNLDHYESIVKLETRKYHSIDDDKNYVEISIWDNGTGIPQKIIEKIFQPFFTTKPTGQGTGLGLSISYDIITKIHNGKLSVKTLEGEFTEFIIQLPA